MLINADILAEKLESLRFWPKA